MMRTGKAIQAAVGCTVSSVFWLVWSFEHRLRLCLLSYTRLLFCSSRAPLRHAPRLTRCCAHSNSVRCLLAHTIPHAIEFSAVYNGIGSSECRCTFIAGHGAAIGRAKFRLRQGQTNVERLICRDVRLAALDKEMAMTYKQILDGLPEAGKVSLRREHLAWFTDYSRLCNGKLDDVTRTTCVTDRLSTRTSQLASSFR
jgi:uncharacterized protein YecT (DUF1311 family)